MELNSSLQEDFSRPFCPALKQNAAMYAWAKRLNTAFGRNGMSVAEFSRHTGIPTDNLHKYLDGKVEKPRGEAQTKLATALGVSPMWLKEGMGPEFTRLPIVGYVGAGEAFIPIDDSLPGAGIGEIEFNLNEIDPIAIEVRGESMVPAYRNGDKLVCSRKRGINIAECIGVDCAVMLSNGVGYLKVLRPGTKPGRFNLVSYNGVFPPIENAELAWVAPVVWVKRTYS